MSRAPLVSIALPCYNQAHLVGETLDSILADDYPNIQVVASDDASTDGTADVLRSYAARYPEKIEVQTHARNLGPVGNVLSIVPRFNGKYIIFFAGDDLFLPGRLQSQVAALEANPDAVLCYSDAEVFDGATGKTLYLYNDPVLGLKPHAGDIVADLIRHRCFIPVITAMFRADTLQHVNHRPQFRNGSDWLFVTDVAARGRVIYLPKPLARYRRHASNITNLVDISEQELTYDLMEKAYPERARDIARGRAALYAVSAFKMLIAHRVADAGRVIAHLVCFLVRHPGTVPVASATIAGQIRQRLALLRRTGRVFR